MASLLIKTTVATALATAVCAQESSKPRVHPRIQAELDTADSYELVQQEHPEVKLSGYVYDLDYCYTFLYLTDLTAAQKLVATTECQKQDLGPVLGVDLNVQADIFASFQAPAFWMQRNDQNWAIFNPSIFGEASAIGSVTFKLMYYEFTLSLKFLGYKFTPLDLQLSWDLDNKSRICYGASLYQEVFDLSIEAQSHVKECYIGVAGFLLNKTNEKTYCEWRRYVPQTPLWQLTVLNSGDSQTDFIPWQCNDYAELETNDAYEENNFEDPSGFEPTVDDEGNDPWAYDPANIVVE